MPAKRQERIAAAICLFPVVLLESATMWAELAGADPSQISTD
jgi:hypothetical protein